MFARDPRTVVALVVLALGVCAAAPTSPAESPEELIRRANAAFRAGNKDEADQLYVAAEERTADPGLVAFNRAAVLFQRGEKVDLREAELLYARVLQDAACPVDRTAKAWYNRGTSLLYRGDTAPVYRSAIACFENCLDSEVDDEPLKADARHNLELAKLLWNQARKSASQLESPNDNRPIEEDDPRSNILGSGDIGSELQPGATEPGKGNSGSRNPSFTDQLVPGAGTTNNPGQAPAPGSSHLQPLQNSDQVQVLSPEDTREYLRRTAERLKKDRQDLLRTLYGGERPGLNDW